MVIGLGLKQQNCLENFKILSHPDCSVLSFKGLLDFHPSGLLFHPVNLKTLLSCSMASAFGHAIAAIGLGKLFPKENMTLKVYVLGAVSAMLPDLDVIGFKFGLQWESMWSHRGFTHSIFFAIAWTILLLLVYHQSEKKVTKFKLGSYYFLTTISHGLLDALTNGGNGIAFFAPFSAERYFFPWKLIQVSPLGIQNFFSEWGLEVLQSEFYFIAIPSLILGLIGHWMNKYVYR